LIVLILGGLSLLAAADYSAQLTKQVQSIRNTDPNSIKLSTATNKGSDGKIHILLDNDDPNEMVTQLVNAFNNERVIIIP
jgi:hypothetical protein